MSERSESAASRTLAPWQRAVYASGDFTINASLNALSFIYTGYFLLHIAGLRPSLAGLVPLVGRTVDALTDPLMGRISDRTRWRLGRRRPYFLIGSLPFALTFALLWYEPPVQSDLGRWLYYAGVYSLLTTAMTVLGIPYLALQPEMALSYDDRTSLNTFRAVGAILGVFAAISMRPLAEWFGGGAQGFQSAGALLGAVFALPWFAVYAVSFERPELHRVSYETGFASGLRSAFALSSFRRLLALFLFSRMAIDTVSTLLILYFTHWLGRSHAFEVGMVLFLASVIAAFPVWLRISKRTDKVRLFITGAWIWMSIQAVLLFLEPDTPLMYVYGLMAVAGAGYAAVDVMPWSMLGEVIDEDELRSGERREGLFHGLFTFFRKLGGAIGVALVLGVLELAGFRSGASSESGSARLAILWLTGLAPAVFLLAAILAARGYPLTRRAHAQLLARLHERRRATQLP
jgi:Na+/melibiose symporter-like transporter